MSRQLMSIVKIIFVAIGALVSQSVSAQVPTTSAEYRFAPEVNDEIGPFVSEIWARVYRPATLTGRYPLIVMLHGMHDTCGKPNPTAGGPRIDDNNKYASDGNCPAGYSVVKSHDGYGYLAHDLASRGYIVVSINANRGLHLNGNSVDSANLRARGRLVLWHLIHLSNWNTDVPTPSTLGFSLQNRIDFSQVGLMGHSRGAIGMRSAIFDYRNSSTWQSRIGEPITFRALIELAPSDKPFGEVDVPNASNINFLHLVGMCDGEMFNGVASQHFDRLTQIGNESGAFFKAVYGIYGANHRYFNTQWQQNDAKFGCVNQTPLFNMGATEIGSASQRNAALKAVRDFFLATVGTKKDPSLARLFDTAYPAPATGPIIARAFSASPTWTNSLRLEDFSGPTGLSSRGGILHDVLSVQYSHTKGWGESDPNYPSAHLIWTAPSLNTYFQINWSHLMLGLDLRPYQYLEFRVDQWLGATPAEFSVRLAHFDNTFSTAVSSAGYVSLPALPATPTGPQQQTFYHPIMRTVRIPLKAFSSSKLHSIRGVRFLFDRGITGGQIHLGSIAATIDRNLAKDKPAVASSVQDNNSAFAGSKATDGSTSSRWSSAFSDSQWIYVDLGASKSFQSVILRWESAFAKEFRLQVSDNASSWATVHTTTNGTGGTQIINFYSAVTRRYVRMLGVKRATQFGYSLREFEVYPN